MRSVPKRLLAGQAPQVAPQLLNKVLVVGACRARIVEVEAYTADDPASHSFRGPTARNAVMFGRAGRLYVYFTYGMHHCANVVTGPAGDGQAVLLRAAAPMAGLDLMAQRRGRTSTGVELANGPGKLCQAFGLDRAWDGATLGRDGVALVDDGVPPPVDPVVTTRVGIRHGVEREWRWCVPGDAHVSRGRPSRTGT